MIKLKLTFRGPNVVANTTRTEEIKVGHGISFEVETLLTENPPLDALKRIWDMERTFNELTRGRLHVDLREVK